MSEEPVLIDWGERRAFRRVKDALRRGETVVLSCRGWRARLLAEFLPRWLEPRARFGWRESWRALFAQLVLFRLFGVCAVFPVMFKRPVQILPGKDQLTVRFERASRMAPSCTVSNGRGGS